MKKILALICLATIILCVEESKAAIAIWTSLDMPGSSWTGAQGVSGNNIVGNYGDASGSQHGFLYNGTTWTTLAAPGSSSTWAMGISGNNIVGGYQDSY